MRENTSDGLDLKKLLSSYRNSGEAASTLLYEHVVEMEKNEDDSDIEHLELLEGELDNIMSTARTMLGEVIKERRRLEIREG